MSRPVISLLPTIQLHYQMLYFWPRNCESEMKRGSFNFPSLCSGHFFPFFCLRSENETLSPSLPLFEKLIGISSLVKIFLNDYSLSLQVVLSLLPVCNHFLRFSGAQCDSSLRLQAAAVRLYALLTQYVCRPAETSFRFVETFSSTVTGSHP